MSCCSEDPQQLSVKGAAPIVNRRASAVKLRTTSGFNWWRYVTLTICFYCCQKQIGHQCNMVIRSQGKWQSWSIVLESRKMQTVLQTGTTDSLFDTDTWLMLSNNFNVHPKLEKDEIQITLKFVDASRERLGSVLEKIHFPYLKSPKVMIITVFKISADSTVIWW